MTRLNTHQYAVKFEQDANQNPNFASGVRVESGWYSSQDDANLLALTRKLRSEKRAYSIIERVTTVRTMEIISWEPPAPPPYQFLLDAPVGTVYVNNHTNGVVTKVSDRFVVVVQPEAPTHAPQSYLIKDMSASFADALEESTQE